MFAEPIIRLPVWSSRLHSHGEHLGVAHVTWVEK